MKIEVLCFAVARDATGSSEVRLDLEVGATVETAVAALAHRHPQLQLLLGRMRYAVNEQFAPVSHPLVDGDTLALIPPVSGG